MFLIILGTSKNNFELTYGALKSKVRFIHPYNHALYKKRKLTPLPGDVFNPIATRADNEGILMSKEVTMEMTSKRLKNLAVSQIPFLS